MKYLLPIGLSVALSGCVNDIYTELMVPRHNILGSGGYGQNSHDITVVSDIQVSDLRIRHVREADTRCAGGFDDSIELDGTIGPDSTAVMQRLLESVAKCKDGTTTYATTVYMNSNGGYLKDGFKLGYLFAREQVDVRVIGEQVCASACAVAFLGGKFRKLRHDARLVFHAPYTSNFLGPDCSDRGQVKDLQNYYRTMIGEEKGDYLLKRTMDYCSERDGWTVNADAAALFGITK